MEKYKSVDDMATARNFLKLCWVKESEIEPTHAPSSILKEIHFNYTQENILTHLAIVNGDY